MLVSICIPTYNRPELLAKALSSLENQGNISLEILIGDDSLNNYTLQMIAARNQSAIKYFKHPCSLGQAANVNFLFRKAQGDVILLLHDDDEMEYSAIPKMIKCLTGDVDVVFGKQRVIDLKSEVDEKASDKLNQYYKRTPELAGKQSSSMWSAISSQFPNDGFMVKKETLQKVFLREGDHIGPACDYFFGVDLATLSSGFFFLNEFTVRYRVGNESILSSTRYSEKVFLNLIEIKVPKDCLEVKLEVLRKHFETGIVSALEKSRPDLAKKIIKQGKEFWSCIGLKLYIYKLLSILPSFVTLALLKKIRSMRRVLIIFIGIKHD
jgi:glycosyltransferase involved in cell wall biosynthesis